MRQIIQGLTPFKEDRHLGKLLTLLQSLDNLCEPLFQSPSEVGGSSGAALSEGNVAQSKFQAPSDFTDNQFSTGPFPSVPFENHNSSIPLTPSTDADSSADWLMWQLFNSQVPTGWLNSDIDMFNV